MADKKQRHRNHQAQWTVAEITFVEQHYQESDMMVEDEVARKLEAAVLWRRVASRWLDVMQPHALTDRQRDRIRQHRKYCLSCAKPISSPEKLDVTEIARAAKAAQERMGMSQPDGATFRLKDREKIRG
ncbi:PerC family transcriptional regulator [Serratia marcescens]